jgi:hypothetical protein
VAINSKPDGFMEHPYCGQLATAVYCFICKRVVQMLRSQELSPCQAGFIHGPARLDWLALGALDAAAML